MEKYSKFKRLCLHKEDTFLEYLKQNSPYKYLSNAKNKMDQAFELMQGIKDADEYDEQAFRLANNNFMLAKFEYEKIKASFKKVRLQSEIAIANLNSVINPRGNKC